MVGREVEVEARAELQAGEPVLSAERLSGTGFRDVTLQVRRGEILALTGAAGAGQTELCWALYGAAPIRSGNLRVADEPVRWRSIRDAIRAGVLLAPGDRKAYGIIPQLDVQANFTFADLKPLTSAGILNGARVRQRALDLIRRYGVRCSGPGQEVQSLSGGNQQKVVVGRVAERRARVYLFDEPTRGVDVGAREEIYRLIHGLAQSGAGVLVSTPDIQEALRLGDRIGVMRAGGLVYEKPRSDATEPAILAAILGGEEKS
jgi:ABC-type sugar transport system ATPase subunit